MARLRVLQVGLIGVGTTTVPLDSAVNIAFPDIVASFALPIPTIQWVVICYVLTHAALMLAFGRIGDLFAHAAVFRAGLACSALAFLACAAAPSFGFLLGARVLQGVGAALVLSCGAALVTGLFPEERRSFALGLYAMIFALGSALGPLVGGLLVETWGWRAVYGFRIPLALLPLLLLYGLPARSRRDARPAFDAVGALLLALTLASMVLALTRLGAGGTATAALLALASAAGFAGFVAWERRSASPLIDLGLFGRRGFLLINATNALINTAIFSVMLLVPFYLAAVAGLPTILAGFVLASGPIGMVVASPVAARALARFSPQAVAITGAALVAIGLFAVSRWDAAPSVALRVPGLLGPGIGAGLFPVANLDLVTAGLPAEDRGVAGSLAMLTRTVGVVGGAALLSLLFGTIETARIATGAGADTAFLSAFRGTLAAAAALAAAITVVLAWRGRSGAPRRV
ncbi:MAG: MFS transporter [Alphaproteobacteria bacterium]